MGRGRGGSDEGLGGGGGGSKVWDRWVMWGMGDVNQEQVVTLAQKQCNCQMSTFQERQKTFLFQTFTFSHIKNQL